MAEAKQPARLTLGEWAVLGLVASGPVHAFAIVKALASRGELGRIWSVPTPVVYRAVDSLRDKLMIATVGEERSDSGPPKTMLQPLVSAQYEAFEPVVAGLEQLATAAGARDFEATLVGWRLESARAVMRFLKGLAVHTPV